MPDITGLSATLTTWKEWARHLNTEILRINQELRELRESVLRNVGEIYSRIDNRHDTVHELLSELEARIRIELANIQTQLNGAVNPAVIDRMQDNIEDSASHADLAEQEVRLRALEHDLVVLKTKSQMWGMLAGAAGAIVIAVLQWWLGKH